MMKLILIGLMILGAWIILIGVTTHAPAHSQNASKDSGNDAGEKRLKRTMAISVPYFFVGVGIITIAVFSFIQVN